MSKANAILIFIPTYNEAQNVRELFSRIRALGDGYDILFIDDRSSDGTGRILDEICAVDKHATVIHRSGKMGIGSAHKDGILWAYGQNYKLLVTMDADFTHSPEKIPDLVLASIDYDIVVASRYLNKGSLNGWNPLRKFLTNLAHFLVKNLIGLKEDATGAFRLYKLDKIPKKFVSLIESDGYSFFFESLYVLVQGGFKVNEVPIILTPRTYGSSKMSLREVFISLHRLCSMTFRHLCKPNPWKKFLN